MSKARKIGSFGKNVHNKNEFEGREGIPYCRVSSKRQETEGSGLGSQEGRCIEDLRRINVPYDRTFADSFSGGGDFMNRPAMRNMLAYIDANPHKRFVVIFDDLSRFARDVFFHIKLRAEFRKRDVILRCLNYNFDESEEGEFAELIFAGKAELDRKQNRRQVVQKQKARLELGYWAFGAKRGYQMKPNPLHGKLLTPIEPDASILKEALEGFSTGRFMRKVDACTFLVEKGFWKKQKPERYIDKFTNILIDPTYAGDIEYPVWGVERRRGYHEGIISVETYEANQSRLNQESRKKNIRIDVSDHFPLRSLLLCEECKKPLTGAFSSGRKAKYPYYRCQNKECIYGRTSIPTNIAHKGFKKLLREQKLKKDVDLLIDKIFERAWEAEIKNINECEDHSVRKTSLLREQLTQITNLIVNTKSDVVRGVYEKQLEEKAREIEVIENDSVAGLDLSIPYRTALKKATGMLKSPYEIWESVDVREQQKLFFFIFDDKLLYSKKAGYRTDNLPCAVRLFEDFVTSNSQDVEMARIEPASE